jgi:glycosyltransferase involved in cell wall biosynthesis
VIRLATNRGAASARNAGWASASGEFVAFLDSDDTWHWRKLEIQQAFMQRNPGVAISAHRCIHGARQAKPLKIQDEPPVHYPAPWSMLFKNPFVTPSVMLRRAVQYRFLEGRRHMEDHLLWVSMALRGERIAILEAPLVNIHKSAYGEAGLSAQMWSMERSELANYRLLQRDGLISLPAMAAFWIWSLAKFAKRLAVVSVRRG